MKPRVAAPPVHLLIESDARKHLEELVDTALETHDVLWASAGTANTVFATTFAELVRVTGGTPARVASDDL